MCDPPYLLVVLRVLGVLVRVCSSGSGLHAGCFCELRQTVSHQLEHSLVVMPQG